MVDPQAQDILLDPVARARAINDIRRRLRAAGVDFAIEFSASADQGGQPPLWTLNVPASLIADIRALNIPSLADPDHVTVQRLFETLANAETQSYGLIMDPRDTQAASAELSAEAAALQARVSALPDDLTYDMGDEIGEVGRRVLASQLATFAEQAATVVDAGVVADMHRTLLGLEDLVASGELETSRRSTEESDRGLALEDRSTRIAEDRRRVLQDQREATAAEGERLYQRRLDSIQLARQEASDAQAIRTEERAATSDRQSRDLEVQTRIDDAITAYFGTPSARAAGLAELRARPDPGAIAQLAATVAVQAQGVGQTLGVPISTKTVVDAVQGSLGLLGKPLRGAVTQAATAAGVSRPTSAPMQNPATGSNAQRSAAVSTPTGTTRPLSTRTTGTVIRPTGTVRPTGASTPRRSTEPGEVTDVGTGAGPAGGAASSRVNPLTQGATRAPNFGGPSSGGGAIIGGPTQAIQGAYSGLANRVRDPADPMTAAEAAQIFGYITQIGDGMLGPGGWQDIGVDPETLIGSLAGLTPDQAADRTDQILGLLEQQRRERVQQAEAERQRAADEAEGALDRTESTRRFDLQQQDQQAGRRFQARQEMNTTSQQRAAMMNSIAQGITSARTGFIGDLFQNASSLAPPTPGARMGGANIYDDLLARIGAPNAGFAQIGGPVPVPNFSADFAQALAEATALGQGQTVESLVA